MSSVELIRCANSRSITMFCPLSLALLSLSIFFSFSSDLLSILSFLKAFLLSISFCLSSSLPKLASLSSHSFFFRSASLFFCSFINAFFSAFLASNLCCFSNFFWAFFERVCPDGELAFSLVFPSFCSASIAVGTKPLSANQARKTVAEESMINNGFLFYSPGQLRKIKLLTLLVLFRWYPVTKKPMRSFDERKPCVLDAQSLSHRSTGNFRVNFKTQSLVQCQLGTQSFNFDIEY